MAMRRTAAAAAAAVRRHEVPSVVATGGRRFLAALSPEQRKERDIESRVRASMELHFDVRVRDIARSEMKEIVMEASTEINSGLDLQLVIENAIRRHSLALHEDLADQKLNFEKKIEDVVKNHDDAITEINERLVKLKDECLRRADAADNRVDLLSQTHDDFASSSHAAVQKTQYDMIKGGASLIATAAAAGALYFLFH